MKISNARAAPHARLKWLCLAALYGLMSWSVRLFFGEASVFFLASGLALAALLIGGWRYLGSVFVGALLANLMLGGVFWASAVMAFGSTLGAAAGAWVIRRGGRFDSALGSMQDLVQLFIGGGLVGAALSALVGTSTLALQGLVSKEHYLTRLMDGWMGDALGVVLLTPLILAWWPSTAAPRPPPSARQLAEAALIIGCTALIGGVVFLDLGHNTLPPGLHLGVDEVAQGYWIFLLITWAALRLAQRGTTLALLLVAAMGITGIQQGKGFFQQAASESHLSSYWFYSITLSLVGMALALYVATARRTNLSLTRSEDALTQELKNVMGALDQHAIVAITDVKGNITFVNDKLCDISGYSRAEFIGANHRLLNSGVHPPEFFKTMYRTIATGKTWSAEVCNRTKAGQLYWMQTTVTPFMNDDGAPVKYVAIRTDISQRKADELELLRHRDQLADMVVQQTASLQQSLDATARALNELERQKFVLDQHAIVTTCGTDGRITFGNEKFTEISGYLPDEFMGVDHAIVNSGHHPKGFFKAMYDTVNQGRLWHAEVCNRAKNGQLYWVDTTIAAFFGDDAKPREYIAIRTNITDRKMMSLQMEQQRIFYEGISETLGEGLYVQDARGLCVYVNSEAEKLLGWSREELIGRSVHNTIHTHTASGAPLMAHDCPITLSVQATGEARMSDQNFVRKDGSIFPVALTSKAAYSTQGEVQTMVVAFHDISAQIEAENAILLAKNSAEQANRVKSEFLANMSHEIRTPMNGVVGMVDILQQTALLPEQRRMLDTIHHSSLALLSILNDILDFSKIEAGKLSMELIPTHLREVVEGVAQLMANVASEKNGQISLFVDPALPTWIVSDPTRLRQVLLNLLGNALKFVASQSGRATLHVHPVRRPDGVACVQFSVLDNGIGMSEEMLARLFQPFSQADTSTARKFGGTGLGLSITLRLVELMHGRVSVRSTPGVGSEFTVELPLIEAQAPAGRTLPAQPDLSGVRVLAVTPTIACSTLLQVYLGSAGARVSVVPDHKAAREHLHKTPGDTVLLLDLAEEGVEELSPPSDLEWPDDVGIVRLVRGGAGSAAAHQIEVHSRPLLYHDLLQGVALASGRLTTSDFVQQSGQGRPALLAAPSIEEALRSHQLILLAEDNETNREVMMEQLRLLGYTAEIATDGALALQMWRSGRYALLLTDCHMPNMDGFELTAAIRQAEPAGTRLPIVAITANAMQGEAQRCREHGMDDFLSKPLRLQELRPMLAKWLPLPPDGPDANETQGPTAARIALLPSWDASMLSQLVGDNPAMHRRLLGKFMRNATRQVAAIGAAAMAGDTASVAGVAHTLKSAARTVGAMALGELSQAMETAGHAGDRPACRALAADLDRTFLVATQNIERHLSAVEPSS